MILLNSVTFATVAVLLFVGAARCVNAAPREETIAIRFSKFDPAVVEARAGEPVTITLRNDDPIEHEWIVGDAGVHERHQTGTEPYHDAIPTEVTIPALSSRVTTVTFEEPGDYRFVCHLPGHEAYGMVGVLRIVES